VALSKRQLFLDTQCLSNQDYRMLCEVCGKSAFMHLTEIIAGSNHKVSHHYCQEHVPPSMQTNQQDELKTVYALLEKLESRDDIDSGVKAKFREQLKKLAEDIAAGRKRFGDPD
jgi:hypothetical protein